MFFFFFATTIWATLSREAIMHSVQLTDAERDLLREILESHLKEMHTEIHHTWKAEFKAMLKEKQHVMMQLMDKLQADLASSRHEVPN